MPSISKFEQQVPYPRQRPNIKVFNQEAYHKRSEVNGLVSKNVRKGSNIEEFSELVLKI
jgi:hypothetical protein